MKNYVDLINCQTNDLDAVAHTEKQYLNFEIKQITDQGEFSGHAAVFDNIDFQGDIIVRGAFAKSLQENNQFVLLSQHNPTKPIGIVKGREDATGLFVEGKLALGVQEAKELRELALIKAVNSFSIGFAIKDSEFDEERNVRIIKEIELFEVSIVTFPANPRANIISMKGDKKNEVVSKKEITDLDNIETLKDAEAYLRAEGLSKNKATAIVSIIKRQLLSESEAPPITNQNLSESDQAKSNQSESDKKYLNMFNQYVSEFVDTQNTINQIKEFNNVY